MNQVRAITRMNAKELAKGYDEASSWHQDYKNSAYLHVSGLPFQYEEKDLLAIFSQYGTLIDINLIRDKGTQKNRGFAFIGYENQKSTNLAVDNLNGIQLEGRTLKVDHCKQYKHRQKDKEDPKPFENLQEKLMKQAEGEKRNSREDWTDEMYEFDILRRKIEKKVRLLDPQDPLYHDIVQKCYEKLEKERAKILLDNKN
jgi:RNA-binding motif protein, X-linked 2